MRLKPSEVTANPSRFPPDTKAVVRAPVGEVDTMALPMALFGITSDDLVFGDLKRGDRFNAQGLEGAFEYPTTWARAYVLVHRCADDRACVLVSGKEK